MPGGRRARGTLVWDAARSGFLPETCGLFSLSHSLNGAATERWMNEGSKEQGIWRPQSKLGAQRRDHLTLRWDAILLSSRGGFLLPMSLNSRSLPFGQDMRMRFKHAIQSILQISY